MSIGNSASLYCSGIAAIISTVFGCSASPNLDEDWAFKDEMLMFLPSSYAFTKEETISEIAFTWVAASTLGLFLPNYCIRYENVSLLEVFPTNLLDFDFADAETFAGLYWRFESVKEGIGIPLWSAYPTGGSYYSIDASDPKQPTHNKKKNLRKVKLAHWMNDWLIIDRLIGWSTASLTHSRRHR